MKTVFVFKTSITQPQQVQQLSPVLNQMLQANEKWNFDLEDCDNILRVEAFQVSAQSIIDQLQHAGFCCSELPD